MAGLGAEFDAILLKKKETETANVPATTAGDVAPVPVPEEPTSIGEQFDQLLTKQQVVTPDQVPAKPGKGDFYDGPELNFFKSLKGGFAGGAQNIADLPEQGLTLLKTWNDPDSIDTQEGLLEIGKQIEEAEKHRSQYVEFKQALDSPIHLSNWLAYTVGEQVPNIGAVLSGVGAAGLAAKLATKSALKQKIAKVAGGYAATVALETGGTIQEQVGATGEIDPEVAVIAGLVKGVPEIVTPLLVGKLGGIIGPEFAPILNEVVEMQGGRLLRTGKSFVVGGGIEGLTEGIQESIDIAARIYVDEKYANNTQGMRDRIFEAIVTGAASGGVITGTITALTSQAKEAGIEFQDTTPITEPIENPDPVPPATAPVTPPATPPVTPVPPVETTEVEEGTTEEGTTTTTPPTTIPVEPAPSILSVLVESSTADLMPYTRDDVAAMPDIVDLVAVGDRTEINDSAEYLTFLPESLAFERGATTEQGGPVARQYTLQATTNSFEGVEKVATLETVGSVKYDEFKKKATIPSEEVETLVVDAHDLLDTDRVAAEKLYMQAIKAGFRFPHQEAQGFIAVNTPKDLVHREQVLSPRVNNPNVQRVQSILRAGANEITYHYEKDNVEYPEGSLTEAYLPTIKEKLAASLGVSEQEYFNVQGLVESGAVEVILPENESNVNDYVNRLLETIDNGTDNFMDVYDDALRSGFRIRFKNEFAQDENLVYVEKKGQRPRVIQQVDTFEELQSITPNKPLQNTLEKAHKEGVLYFKQEPGLRDQLDQVDVNNVKPGEVLLVPPAKDGSKLLHRRAKLAVNVLNRLVKLFNPKGIYVLGVAETLYADPGKLSPWGWHLDAGTSVHYIALEKGESVGKFLSTLTHEFGHSIAVDYINTAIAQGNILGKELLSAYDRWRFRASMLKTSSVANIQEGMGIYRGLLIMKSGIDVNIKQLYINSYRDHTYMLSFDEFMAEQMAQFVETQTIDSDGSRLSKVFIGLKNKLSRMYKKAFNISPESADIRSPADAFITLLEGIRNGTLESKETEQKLRERVYGKDTWLPHIKAKVSKDSVLPGVLPLVKHPIMKKSMSMKMEDGKTLGQKVEETGYQAGYFNSIVKWGWNIIQLAEKNKEITQVQDYLSITELWSNEKSKWQARANDTLRNWRTLGKERADRFASFVFDLNNMVYLKKGEKPRNPTKAEMEALIAEHKLDKGQWALYLRVKSDFDAILARMEEELIRHARNHLGVNTGLFVLEEAKIKKEFKLLRGRPYFPQSRFGNYSIVVTNKGGKVVHLEHIELSTRGSIAASQGKTPQEVVQRKKELLQGFKEGEYEVGISLVPETMRPFSSLPLGLLKTLKEVLGGQLDDASNAWLDQIALNYTPVESFRKRFKKRKNTPGYSTDAMRAYADYFWHGSNHMARITYGQQLKEVIADFRGDISKKLRGGHDVSTRERIARFLEDHMEAILNPQADWAQLRSIAFMWWMGFSPAAAALNFTQVPLVTLPTLSARFGDGATIRELTKAMLELRKMYGDPATIEANWNEDDAKLITIGLTQNFLEESLATELSGVAEGSNLVRARHGTATQRAMTSFANASSWMFQASEKINRRLTFTAAVRLARQQPNNPYLKELRTTKQLELSNLIKEYGLNIEEATAFLAGKHAVQNSQFEYAAWAKPRFMRGRKGVIFTFYMFLQNMLFTVTHGTGNKRVLLMMLGMAGLMGLPGAEDLFALADKLGKRMFGKYFKLEEEITKFLVELTNPETADVLMHGTGRVGFGLPALGDMTGIPIPKFDMSGSVGMGSVVPGLQEVLKSGGPQDSFESTLGRAATDIAGASYGVAINFWKFANDQSLPIDDAKRWERAMPRAMKNVTRAMRYVPPDTNVAAVTGNFVTPEGRERSRTGSTIIAFDGDDSEHMAEIAMQAFGFAPTRLNREWNKIIAQSDAVNYWKGRRGILLSQYWQTLYTGDKESSRDVIAAMRAFNSVVPYPEMGISRDNLRDSVKARKKNMLLREADQALEKRYRRLHEETGSIYPE